MPLADIKQTLGSPEFELVGALQAHRKRLVAEQKRFSQLLLTIDETIKEINGERTMENPFKGFSAEKQKSYEKELLENGNEQMRVHVKEAIGNVKNMSEQDHDVVKEEGHNINLALVCCLKEGENVHSKKVQALIGRHHGWVSNYWVPAKDAYIGLGQNYINCAEFCAFYNKYDARLAEFLADAMAVYAETNLK